jgi:hypothetical protein
VYMRLSLRYLMIRLSFAHDEREPDTHRDISCVYCSEQSAFGPTYD